MFTKLNILTTVLVYMFVLGRIINHQLPRTRCGHTRLLAHQTTNYLGEAWYRICPSRLTAERGGRAIGEQGQSRSIAFLQNSTFKLRSQFRGCGMQKVEFSLERVLPIWWAFVWRAGVASMIAGVVAGFIGGYIVSSVGSPELGRPVGAIFAWLASIPCSVWAFRQALALDRREYVAGPTTAIAPEQGIEAPTSAATSITAPNYAALAAAENNVHSKGGEGTGIAIATVAFIVLIGLLIAFSGVLGPNTTPAAAILPAPEASDAPSAQDQSAASAALDAATAAADAAAFGSASQSAAQPSAAVLTMPSLANLGDDDRQSIQSVCLNDKDLNGPAAYDRCLSAQLARLSQAPPYPDLSGLTDDERQSINSTCLDDKDLNGPAAFHQCLTNQLALMGR